MDYDFFPTLRHYNNSNITIFLDGDYFAGTEYKNGSIIESHSSKPFAMGPVELDTTNIYH